MKAVSVVSAALVVGLVSFAAWGEGEVGARGCSDNPYRQYGAGTTFHVNANKKIVDPNGNITEIFGVQMFDGLFVNFGDFRGWNSGAQLPINQIYRQEDNPPGKGPGTGISEPTYAANWQYINHEYVYQQLSNAKQMGVNFIRVQIEPAVEFASVSYVDPTTGLTFPSDPVMLDDVVNTATQMGIIVELNPARDEANFDPTGPVPGFLVWLAGRYGTNPLVWMAPANEFGWTPFQTSPTTIINNPNAGVVSTWSSDMSVFINALRNNGYHGPIVLNDAHFGESINGVFSTITTTSPFNTDGNIVYGIHEYTAILSGTGPTLSLQSSFPLQTLPGSPGGTTDVFQYLGQFPMFIEETAMSCGGGSPTSTCDDPYPPDLPGGSISLPTWVQMMSWSQSEMQYIMAISGPSGPFSGMVIRAWFAYGQNGNNTDNTAFFNHNNGPTAWLALVRQWMLSYNQDGCQRRYHPNKSLPGPNPPI